MTLEEARVAISDRFNGQWSDAPVAWSNRIFTIEDYDEWVRFSVLFGAQTQASFGDTGSRTVRTAGAIIIQIFTLPDKGVKRANELAQSAQDIFSLAQFSGISCSTPSLNVVGNYEGWYQVNVSIPFYFDKLV